MGTGLKITLGIFGFLMILGALSSIGEEPGTVYITGNAIGSGSTDSNVGSAVESGVADSNTKKASKEKVQILEHELAYGDYGNLMVKGIAQNTAGKELSYAEIDVKFYDSDGILISSSLDNINNLEAGEKWRFEVMYFGMDSYEVDSYKVSVGSIW